MRKRTSPQTLYSRGVEWIAFNDEPEFTSTANLSFVADMISVMLLADMFDVEPRAVARHVVRARNNDTPRGGFPMPKRASK